MNITPFEIYLIMQADSLRSVLAVIVTIAGGGLCIGAVLAPMFWDILGDQFLKPMKRLVKIGLTVFALSAFGNAMIPSSKSLATMYLVPEVMNNEAISTEAKEIYNLMKDGLKGLVEVEEKGHSH